MSAIFLSIGDDRVIRMFCVIFAPPLLEAAASTAEKDSRRLYFLLSLLTLAIKKEEEGNSNMGRVFIKVDFKLW